MSRLTEAEKWPNHEELIFPCDCGGGDYLRITWDEDPEWRCLWVEAWAQKVGLWKRIKGAWATLRDQAWQHTEIVLTPEVCKELGEYLLSKTTDKETQARMQELTLLAREGDDEAALKLLRVMSGKPEDA